MYVIPFIISNIFILILFARITIVVQWHDIKKKHDMQESYSTSIFVEFVSIYFLSILNLIFYTKLFPIEVIFIIILWYSIHYSLNSENCDDWMNISFLLADITILMLKISTILFILLCCYIIIKSLLNML